MPFSVLKKSWKPALVISLIYLVSGIVWIWVSDRIPVPFITSQETMLLFQTIKGFVYVSITAVLLFFLIYRQIRKQNNLIKLLRKRNRLMNFALSQHSGLNVLLLDREMVVLQAFGKERLWSGKKMTEVPGDSIYEWSAHGRDKQMLQHFFKKTREKGKNKKELKIKDQWYFLKANLLPDSSGQQDLMLLLVDNISQHKHYQEEQAVFINKNRVLEQKVAEEAYRLRSQQLKFREVFDGIGDGVIIRQLNAMGQTGLIENINRSALHLLGLNSMMVTPEGLWRHIVGDNQEAFHQFLNHVYTETSQLHLAVEVETGSVNRHLLLKSRYLNTGARPYVMIVISEQPQTIDSEGLQSSLLYRMLNKFPDGVLLISPELRCIYCNPTMREWLKWNAAEESSASIHDLKRQFGDMDVIQQVSEALEGDVVQSIDFQLPHLENRWFSSVFYPVTDHSGRVEVVVRITRDVSVRRSYEETLYNQQNVVDESNRLKTLFLSNLSHEVRTPMNGIMGFVELLEQDEISEIQRYYLDLIRRSGDNLLSILDGLVEIARLENGQVTVHKQWMEPLPLVHEIESYLREKLKMASKQLIEVHIRVDKEVLPEKIYSDPDKIREVLHLLVDNAVKFTQQGWIEVGAGYSGNGHLSFWVHDTGIGIKKLSKYQIFQPFMTYNDSENVLYGGLGLGLSIAKGLSDVMGASIELESEVGKGSKFLLSVPLQLGENADKGTPVTDVAEPGKVLVVQYGLPTDSVIQLLKQYNVKLLHAVDGTAAIDLLFEVRDIDLIIADVRLSDMDAFELIHALKRINAMVPVIAQTAYFIAEEKQRCMNEGFADYLVKPVDHTVIIKLLRKL
ncbi:ATP-binding protein [Geofilum rubicundum]|nr:ATP-binding protein [Geofilum rubicundum]